jgi:three-Cys-motif partner protein
MGKDFHAKPFDEPTSVKLSLYGDYLKEWLPVFLNRCSSLNIFDFFAGPGRDSEGKLGSPLLTLRALHGYLMPGPIGTKVAVLLNDQSKKKYESLVSEIEQVEWIKGRCAVHPTCLPFEAALDKYRPILEAPDSANFAFIDQTGIKHLTPGLLRYLSGLPRTDFLFFSSSSVVHRFCDVPEIRKYHGLSEEDLKRVPYARIHETLVEYWRSLLSSNRIYYLSPFTLKKGANIYGLVFGTGHVLGLDKFVRACWREDPLRGSANFDIDGDHLDIRRPALFADMNKSQKLKRFEDGLSEDILKRNVKTNHELYVTTLERGFLPRHGKAVATELIRNRQLPKQTINVSYDAWQGPEKPIKLT